MSDLIQDSLTNTYKTTLGTDEVIIGGKDPSVFKPEIEFTRWNKENSLTIKPLFDIPSAVTTLIGNKIEYKGDKIGWYANPVDENMKFGIILYEKPPVNTWTFTLEGHDNLVKIKRPPLNKDNGNGTKTFDSSGGLEEHIDSQRFYREVTALETVNGREVLVPHLEHGLTFLRPKFIDAKGDWIWADLEIQGSDYIVTVDQKWLEKAVYPVKANDSGTYQEGVSGYTGCIDTVIKSSSSDTNYNANGDMSFYGTQGTLIAYDLSSILSAGSTITAVTLNFYMHYGQSLESCSVYRVLKPWTEAGATWNDWVSPNSEWGTAGCNSVGDDAGYNTGDGTGNDRWSTADVTRTMNSPVGNITFDSTSGLVATLQSNLDNSKWYGWIIRGTSADDSVRDSEYVTTAQRPSITITYTAGAGGAAPLTGYMSCQKGIW